jgi:uncharacterized alkaline shock family protein YloU
MDTGLTNQSTHELGAIQIAPEVLETIAALATMEIDGVAELSGGIVGGISDLLGMKSITRGIKVQIGTNETIIDVSIAVHYGYRIPDVSREIQNSVQLAIYNMTGIHVTAVHIHIESVQINEAKSVDSEAIHTNRLS